MQITIVGLDLAKRIFQVHAVDASGSVVVRKALRRSQVLPFFTKLPSCLIDMEACGTSHYWARELTELGHEVACSASTFPKDWSGRSGWRARSPPVKRCRKSRPRQRRSSASCADRCSTPMPVSKRSTVRSARCNEVTTWHDATREPSTEDIHRYCALPPTLDGEPLKCGLRLQAGSLAKPERR